MPEVPTSIFAVMSAMAMEYDAINLSQGYPDFESDPVLIDLVNKAMQGGFNQYAPMPGLLSLRKAITKKIKMLYGVDRDPEKEITITAGATQAIFTALAATIKKGDEVIILKPAYDCYEPSIQLLGGVPICLQLDPKEFKIDWEALNGLISRRTKMIIINTPHNPSGNILTDEDMKKLEALLNDSQILLLSDEVYEHIIFDKESHQSAMRYPNLAERAFVTASFGKTFHNTGWKMGYCVAPPEMMKEFRKVHQFNVFSVNHPIQVALTEYLQDAERYLNLGSFYQRKRDLFLNEISGSRFEFKPSKGTYFQPLDYTAISDESDTALAARLTQDFKVACIPISAFNEPGIDTGVLRFCFAKKDETLVKAAKILKKL
jgi:methionine aminotransferase